MWNREKNLTWKSYRLSSLIVRCSHFTLGNPKSHFSTVLFIHISEYLRYLTRKQSVIYVPTPPENVTTLIYELQNFFIRLNVCCVLSDIGGSEKSQLWIVSGSEKKPAVVCGNWNVSQAMSQQVFRVTTFCINTCFQSSLFRHSSVA